MCCFHYFGLPLFLIAFLFKGPSAECAPVGTSAGSASENKNDLSNVVIEADNEDMIIFGIGEGQGKTEAYDIVLDLLYYALGQNKANLKEDMLHVFRIKGILGVRPIRIQFVSIDKRLKAENGLRHLFESWKMEFGLLNRNAQHSSQTSGQDVNSSALIRITPYYSKTQHSPNLAGTLKTNDYNGSFLPSFSTDAPNILSETTSADSFDNVNMQLPPTSEISPSDMPTDSGLVGNAIFVEENPNITTITGIDVLADHFADLGENLTFEDNFKENITVTTMTDAVANSTNDTVFSTSGTEQKTAENPMTFQKNSFLQAALLKKQISNNDKQNSNAGVPATNSRLTIQVGSHYKMFSKSSNNASIFLANQQISEYSSSTTSAYNGLNESSESVADGEVAEKITSATYGEVLTGTNSTSFLNNQSETVGHELQYQDSASETKLVQALEEDSTPAFTMTLERPPLKPENNVVEQSLDELPLGSANKIDVYIKPGRQNQTTASEFQDVDSTRDSKLTQPPVTGVEPAVTTILAQTLLKQEKYVNQPFSDASPDASCISCTERIASLPSVLKNVIEGFLKALGCEKELINVVLVTQVGNKPDLQVKEFSSQDTEL